MKDILKVMHMDLITSSGSFLNEGKTGLMVYGALLILFLLLPLFLSPFLSFYVIFASCAMIVPLQNSAKGDLGHLYGILPVKRKNITRARFLFIFFIHLISELAAFVIALISIAADLNRFIPEGSELAELGREYYDMENFTDNFAEISTVFIGFSLFFCFIFAFMEMMGQIHGRENEMKILFMLLGGIVVVVIAIVSLTGAGVIPYMDFSGLVSANAAVTAVILHITVLGLCVLFGEITAVRTSAREL